MPDGPRIRANNVYGTISNNPVLTAAASTFESGSLPLLPVVQSAHAVIVFDPKRVFGDPEIVVVTIHTAASTVATILRGQYGTSPREHPFGTAWAHVPIDEDFIENVLSSDRPSNPYRGQIIFERDLNRFVARDTSDTWQVMVPLGAWTTYTPTLTQGVTVAKTVNGARYSKVGRTVRAQVYMTVTGAGTASTIVLAGLPFACNGAGNYPMGTGYIYDLSANLMYKAIVVIQVASDTIGFLPTNTTGAFDTLGNNVFTLGLAAGDIVTFNVTYESTT